MSSRNVLAPTSVGLGRVLGEFVLDKRSDLITGFWFCLFSYTRLAIGSRRRVLQIPGNGPGEFILDNERAFNKIS
jgi:hypothetical protein